MRASFPIDPRTRLSLVFCLTAGALLFNRLSFLVPLLLLTAVLGLAFGGIGWALLKRAKWLIGFFILVALLQSIFNQTGAVLLAVKSQAILTTGGLEQGGCFICRMSVILLAAGIFIPAGTRAMVQGLIALKIPMELAFMTTCALSFIPLFTTDLQNSLIALQLRGVELGKIKFRQRIKVYTYLLVPVLESLIIKARELSCAMEMRAFRAYNTRSSYLILTLRPPDYLLIAAASLGLIGGLVAYYH